MMWCISFILRAAICLIELRRTGVPDCKNLLDQLLAGEVKATFVEGMGCPGGCVGGPKRIVDKSIGKDAVNREAYDSSIKVPVNSEILMDLLRGCGGFAAQRVDV